MSNLKTIVFLETSLTHAEAQEILPEASYGLSVKKGDVIKAIKSGYTRIVIIDGSFAWTPAVWHKEILMALDYGLEVFGASSMGALRAAELDVYGMQGVGTIYEMYKVGVIEGDDEVAIAYSAHTREQTVPLVNIRMTLEQLQLSVELKESILQQIKSIYYAERTWHKMAMILPEALYRLIYDNYIDIKRQDARLLLKKLKENRLISNKVENQQKRAFTLFEKKLMESTFDLAIMNPSWCEKQIMDIDTSKGMISHNQLIRSKNIMKLLSMAKTRKNLLYCQQLIHQIDLQQYTLTQVELMEQVNLFREENNLLKGSEFKAWLIQKYLVTCHLQMLFMDYFKIKKYFCMSFNYHYYLVDNV